MAGLNFVQAGDIVRHTPAGALAAGDPVRLSDGRIGVAVDAIAASAIGNLQLGGIWEGPANSSDTWSKGDILCWDDSADKIVKAALTLDGSADMVLGTAQAAKTSGQTTARVQLNEGPRNQGVILQSVPYEFDVQTGVDADAHVLIPAEQNPHGLLLIGVYGVITEQMAGSSQDQGIVSIRHGTTAVSTLTPSDAAADAIGDIIVGSLSAAHASTGAVAPVIPAGLAVNGIVTQATSGGSPAGKYKVYIIAVPLL